MITILCDIYGDRSSEEIRKADFSLLNTELDSLFWEKKWQLCYLEK